jgi:NADPH-dependent 2,4-dienoyl-CoA reductase/sulfur reductase-like enzyme
MGAHAARRLLGGDEPGEPYAPLPYFWSDQYDRKIQLSGWCGPADDIEFVAGGPAEERFVAFIGRQGRLIGVLGMNMAARVARWGRLVDEGTGWDDALALARAE